MWKQKIASRDVDDKRQGLIVEEKMTDENIVKNQKEIESLKNEREVTKESNTGMER